LVESTDDVLSRLRSLESNVLRNMEMTARLEGDVKHIQTNDIPHLSTKIDLVDSRIQTMLKADENTSLRLEGLESKLKPFSWKTLGAVIGAVSTLILVMDKILSYFGI